jgi:hypothetical protein
MVKQHKSEWHPQPFKSDSYPTSAARKLLVSARCPHIIGFVQVRFTLLKL